MTGERDGHMGLFPLVSHARPLHLAADPRLGLSRGHVRARIARSSPISSALASSRSRECRSTRSPRRVRPLVTRDNESSLILRLPEFMITAEILHGLGIAPDASRRAAHGRASERRARRRDASPRSRDRRTGIVDPGRLGTACAAGVRAPALAPKPAADAVVRARSIAAGPSTPSTRTQRSRTSRSPTSLLRRARNPKVRRVIVDVRLNGGGDNTSYCPCSSTLCAAGP